MDLTPEQILQQVAERRQREKEERDKYIEELKARHLAERSGWIPLVDNDHPTVVKGIGVYSNVFALQHTSGRRVSIDFEVWGNMNEDEKKQYYAALTRQLTQA